jgi:hypothetical protein
MASAGVSRAARQTACSVPARAESTLMPVAASIVSGLIRRTRLGTVDIHVELAHPLLQPDTEHRAAGQSESTIRMTSLA